MMGIALGGIGVLSLRLPFTVPSSFFHLVDLPTILLATCLVALFALIAYFTNPTEASFRTHLTELAFRQHLSRLSEAQDVHPGEDCDDARLRALPYNKGAHKHSAPEHGHSEHTSTSDTPIVFHFANKAAISFRTPGYHFRSFAVLTFAMVSPVDMNLAPAQPKPVSWTNPSPRGMWFVGAFGKWWLGLEMAMHPRPVRIAAQDDDGAIAGARGEDGDSTSATRHAEDAFPPHKASHSKPGIPRRASSTAPPRTKAALRERLSLQTQIGNANHKRDTHAHAPPRPTTPPPLPKSASLPLHAKRLPPPSPENRKSKTERPTSQHHSPPLLPTSNTTLSDSCSPARSRTPSTQDLSPVITDILKQLDAARSATSDLHTQLTEFQGASALAHAGLQTEVDAARATKKADDAGRAEVKAKTKYLDDARRQADGSKREAEKKLKAAAAARDGATGRIERLAREMEELQRRMVEDEERVVDSRVQAETECGEITEALAAKREEIKIAEDVVVALTARARDLEGKISEEVERLQKMKEDAEARRQHAASLAPQPDTSSWPPPLLVPTRDAPRGQIGTHQLAPTLGTDTARPPEFHRTPTSPRPHPLTLAGISNLSAAAAHMNGTGNGNAIMLDGEYAPSSQFRPFADSPISPSSGSAYAGPLSPVSTSLIPSSLIQSLESPRSALPNGDPFFGQMINSGPTVQPAVSDELHSPVDEPDYMAHVNRFDSQRAVLPPRPPSPVPHEDESAVSKPRRWFSTSAKEKGLNPDAKVFTLTRGRPFALGSGPGSGASTPAAFGSDVFHPSPAAESPPLAPAPRLSVAGSFFSSVHNAFAPSPAEREALQRALGSGSGNASLERVSSHGSGSGSGGSHHSSPHAHWGGDGEALKRRDLLQASPAHRNAFFNPWFAPDGKPE